jgi:3-hydroxybutyrate dehydrogenase
LKNVDVAAGDKWVTPEEVAVAMLDLVEKDECQAGRIEGGCILEVGKDQLRFVNEFNDPGPSGAGHSVSGMGNATDKVLASLREEGWGKSGH